MNLGMVRPTWRFWVILLLGYFGGFKTMLVFLYMMAIVILFSITLMLVIPRERSLAVELGLLNKDSWLVKLFCWRGKCTWSKVEIDEPRNSFARLVLDIGNRFEKRIGKSNCVSCGKELWLDSYVNGDKGGKPYWTLADWESFEFFGVKDISDWKRIQAEK